jgi:hypothetical protein
MQSVPAQLIVPQALQADLHARVYATEAALLGLRLRTLMSSALALPVTCSTLVSCLANYLTPKMEVTCFSESSRDFTGLYGLTFLSTQLFSGILVSMSDLLPLYTDYLSEKVLLLWSSLFVPNYRCNNLVSISNVMKLGNAFHCLYSERY